MINTVKYLKEKWSSILLGVLFLMLLAGWLWQFNCFPLKYQPKLFYVHSDKAETYPKLGLIISLQSVKQSGAADEVGARGFRLVTCGQPPIQKESVAVGDNWDFQVNGVQYRLVFKYFTYCDAKFSAVFELSQIRYKKTEK